jgi:tetratricopeptide (TPR) repeat protein
MFQGVFRFTFFLVLWTCACSSGFSQEEKNAQTETITWLTLAEDVLYRTGNIDSSMYYFQQAESLIHQKKENQFLFRSGLIQAQILTRKHDVDSSIRLLENLLITTTLSPTEKEKGQFYYHLGFNYFLKNQSVNAMESYTRAMRFFEEANDQDHLALVYCRIAGLYSAEEQYDRSLEYISKARAIAQKTTDPFIKTSVLSSITGRFLHVGTVYPNYLDSTIYYGQRAMTEVQKNGYYTYAAHICNSVSSAFSLQQKPDEAYTYLQLATQFSAQLHKGESIITYFNLCDFYLNTEKYEPAQIYLDTIFMYARELQDAFYMRLAYERQYLISKSLGNMERALTAFENYTRIQDSLFNAEKSQSINEISEKYQSEIKDGQIQNLEQKNSLNKLRIVLLISGIVAVISVLLLLILLFLRKSQKQKRIQLETELRLNRLRINPHFFFNLLGSFQTLSYSDSDKNKVPVYISKLSKIMRRSLESSFTDFIPLSDEIQFIEEYTEILRAYSNTDFSLKIQLDQSLTHEEYIVPSMIFQPFIENAIEHGFKKLNKPGILEVDFKTSESTLMITITDNGIWEENQTSANHVSRATQITRDRIDLIRQKFSFPAKLSVNRDSENGTTIVQIVLPLLTENENTGN